MPSIAITGVSRGIGYELLKQYSDDANNTVIGIVRNKSGTENTIAQDAELKGRSNIHILQADVVDYDAMKEAAAATAKITGGSLDCLVANAGIVPPFDAYDGIGTLGAQPELLTKTMRDLFDVNVISNVHLINLFMPLILKGAEKKVIAISSGLADLTVVNEFDLTAGPLYAASKAALNMIMAKFSAQYKQEGVLFLSICPGMVEVGHYKDATQQQMQGLGGTLQKFASYAPDFKGPATPQQAVGDIRSVISKASIEKGDGGDFVSHYGNKQWL